MISVIIPCFNHEKELLMTLHTLLEQSAQPDMEVIVVDDGSTPAIREEVVRAAYPNPLIFLRQENKGAPAARNAGFVVSRGEFVIFWDADIVAQKEMLRLMHAVLVQHKEVGYVYADHWFGHVPMRARAFSVEAMREKNYIHSTSLLRREVVVPWDETLKRFQDWDLWLMLAEKGVCGHYIPALLFKVQTHGTMSSWLPRFAYRTPWKLLPWWRKRVTAYEQASMVVQKKHGLGS